MNMEDTIREFMTGLFYDISSIEEKSIRTKFSNMTINDMRVIEAIAPGEKKNMSTVAKTLRVTMGTLTISVNSLVKKGYVSRVRSEKDRRVVLVSLTELGISAYEFHQHFYKEMMAAAVAGLDDEEQKILARTLKNLGAFFKAEGHDKKLSP